MSCSYHCDHLFIYHKTIALAQLLVLCFCDNYHLTKTRLSALLVRIFFIDTTYTSKFMTKINSDKSEGKN